MAGLQMDFVLLITIFQSQHTSQFPIYISIHFSHPYCTVLFLRILWTTVSKVCETQYRISTVLTQSTELAISSQQTIRLVSHDFRFVNSCSLLPSALSFICLEMVSRIICSTTFPGTSQGGEADLPIGLCIVLLEV